MHEPASMVWHLQQLLVCLCFERLAEHHTFPTAAPERICKQDVIHQAKQQRYCTAASKSMVQIITCMSFKPCHPDVSMAWLDSSSATLF